MPVVIGKNSPGFSDPIALMSDCHRRIEMFLRALQSVAASGGGPLDEERRRALETALKYFREAAPKHTADEENSLFPRMRRKANVSVRALFEEVDRLEQDHHHANRLHEEVDRIGREWLSAGEISREEAQKVNRALDELTGIYAEHIAMEDQHVFPAAAEALSPAEKAEIAREMAERRQVSQR